MLLKSTFALLVSWHVSSQEVSCATAHSGQAPSGYPGQSKSPVGALGLTPTVMMNQPQVSSTLTHALWHGRRLSPLAHEILAERQVNSLKAAPHSVETRDGIEEWASTMASIRADKSSSVIRSCTLGQDVNAVGGS